MEVIRANSYQKIKRYMSAGKNRRMFYEVFYDENGAYYVLFYKVQGGRNNANS